LHDDPTARIFAMTIDSRHAMIDPDRFTETWLEAWNSHDLDSVLAHYAEDFSMSSPLVTRVTGIKSGTLRGKAMVRKYWEAALGLFPRLRFECIGTFVGAKGLAIHYKGADGRLSVEVFRFSDDGLVIDAAAYYLP
jgi:ketosteroid isomerase-like protein